MYTNILTVLCCPHCGARFQLTESKKEGEEIMEGKIVCKEGHAFYVHDGILDFQSQEQEIINSWNKFDKDESLTEIDYKIDANKTENQWKIENDFIDAIVREVKNLRTGFLLDVASGRGMLLRELLKNVEPDVEIISADLSFHILKQDRLKFKKSNPHARVNYIACDATKLPIQDDSINMVCTFAGFTNMANLMENGIRDAARVLKTNAPLINSCVYMDENAEGAKKAARYLSENHMEGAEKIYIRNALLEIHKKYFRTVREKVIYEGTAEVAEGDLIPCTGEWFANVVLIAE